MPSPGGASGGTLYNCTLTGNSGNNGGGACGGTLYNCIVYFNTAVNGANYYSGQVYQVGYVTLLSYCCTTPIQTTGVGNITNAPLFVDYAGDNLHQQPNSPCVNAGNNSYVTNTTALDGLPRIVSGTVDIGAYEYQGAGSTIS